MKGLFVSGTFNDEGGKKSGLMEKIAENLKKNMELTVFNGGIYHIVKKKIPTSGHISV